MNASYILLTIAGLLIIMSIYSYIKNKAINNSQKVWIKIAFIFIIVSIITLFL